MVHFLFVVSEFFFGFASGIFYVNLRNKKVKQTTFCWCKNCQNELCSDPQTKAYDAGSEVHYVCGKCGWQNDFMFDAPVPIFMRSFK